jgi:DtxR family Mn-dependent transcriptional regulator
MEYFLAEKLKFSWDEVHEVAEQLEHVSSKKLIDKLDEYLGSQNLIRMVILYPIPMGKWKQENK